MIAREDETGSDVLGRWWAGARRLIEERHVPLARGEASEGLSAVVEIDVVDADVAFPILLEALAPSLCLWSAADGEAADLIQISLLVGDSWHVVLVERDALGDDAQDGFDEDEDEDEDVLVLPAELVELSEHVVADFAAQVPLGAAHDRGQLGRSLTKALERAVRKEPDDVRALYARHQWQLSRMAMARLGSEVLDRHIAILRADAAEHAQKVRDQNPEVHGSTKEVQRRAVERYVRTLDTACPVRHLTEPVVQALARIVQEESKGIPLI